MVRRKRSKSRPVPRLSPVIVVVGMMAVFCAVGFGLWKVWPTVREHAVAALSRISEAAGGGEESSEAKAPVRKAAGKRTSKPAPSAASTEGRLKNRNEQLLAEIRRLRAELQRTSETLAQKEAELNEIKLQRLIHERMQD